MLSRVGSGFFVDEYSFLVLFSVFGSMLSVGSNEFSLVPVGDFRCVFFSTYCKLEFFSWLRLAGFHAV
jgi:hypothetical protein